MGKNKIRELRTKKALTQKQLAALVGTSQQQIQRIENGMQSVRFDLAVRICEALGETADIVFPDIEAPLVNALKRGVESPYDDALLVEELEKLGFEMDLEYLTLRYRLRGGIEGNLSLTKPEQKRFYKLAQQVEDEGFIVFDSAARRFAINRDHLIYWHFCFDLEDPNDQDEDETSSSVEVILSDGHRLEFLSLPDSEEEDNSSAMKHVFGDAENGSPILSFLDGNGEKVFLRSKEVSLLSAPLIDLYPGMGEENQD